MPVTTTSESTAWSAASPGKREAVWPSSPNPSWTRSRTGGVPAIPPKNRFVAARPRVEILLFHRHGMDVGGGDGDATDQGFLQVEVVALRVSGRRDPFVDLEQVNALPGDVLPGESPERQPRRRAAADRQRASTPRRHRFPRNLRDPFRSPYRDGPGVGKNLRSHDVPGGPGAGAGSCHRSGATSASASRGPQVPGSYGNRGGAVFRTGSTIRHASST